MLKNGSPLQTYSSQIIFGEQNSPSGLRRVSLPKRIEPRPRKLVSRRTSLDPASAGKNAQNRSPSVPVSLYHGRPRDPAGGAAAAAAAVGPDVQRPQLINGRARIGSIGFGMRRALERFPLPLERGVSVFVGTPRKVSDTIHLLSRPLSAKSYRMIHLERSRN
jgi:hypothetical protein